MADSLFGYTSFGAVSAGSDGQSVSPVYTFDSERSLGFYRSAASTIALSSGATLASRISAIGTVSLGASSNLTSTFSGSITVGGSGQTATPLTSFSYISTLGVAMVVAGSASSFSLFVWPAVRPADAISVVPLGAGVSSLSSGLVLHSHCTQAGQCELRWSNVSTLVQNQSAVTYHFYRWSGGN